MDNKTLLPKAVADLAKASYAGAFIYTAVFVTIIYATGYQGNHPAFTLICVCTMGLAGLARLFLAIERTHIDTGAWVRWFSLLTLVMVSVWSSYWSYVIHTDGLNQTTMISIAASVGIASAGIGTLAPMLKTSYGVLFILMWPIGLVLSYQPDGVGIAYAMMMLIGSFFLSFVNVRLHRQYWTTQRNAALLEERASQLSDATSAKSEFLARMSHEIRTPLNGILGMAQMLQLTKLDERQNKYTGIIRHSGEALLTIINDILDLSKIEAGRFELSTGPFSIADTINDTMELLGPEATRQGLALQCDIADDIPALLQGDVGRLRQILLNLVGNAIKFTDEGTVSVRATSRMLVGQRVELCIKIKDTGIGITASARKRVFEAFNQETSGSGRPHSGTGLGLTITRHLVDMMAGKMTVESNEGQGTVFTLNIPMAVHISTEQAPAAAATSHADRTTFNPLTHKSVLVAEDNQVNRFYASEVLKAIGCEVTTADDGIQAVEAHGAGHFDAILMDMQLPNMNGMEATRAIREVEGNTRHTPIIAITANALEGERENCIKAGLDDYISKPYGLLELQTVLERWIASAGQHDQLH